MFFFDGLASPFTSQHPALLPAVRSALRLGALGLQAALCAGAIGCGSVVIDEDGSHGTGGSAGEGGAGATTSATGGGLVCPTGAWGRGLSDVYKYEYGEGVAVDPSCNVVVSGSFGGTMDLGGLSISGQDEDVFVAKFNPFGEVMWGLVIGTEPFQGSAFTATDAAGNVAVAGTYDGTIDIAGETLVAKKEGIFAIKLDTHSKPLWARSFGDDYEAVLEHVAFTSDGGMVLVGYAGGGTVDFGKGPVGQPGTTTAFVAKLDANGAAVWSVGFDGSGARTNAVAATADGGLWVAGSFQQTVQVGPFKLEDTFGTIPFFARLGPDGQVLSAAMIPGTNARDGKSVAATPDGGALIAGNFQEAIDLGAGLLTAEGSFDGYLLSVDPSGKPRWGTTFGGPSVDAVAAIAATPDGGAWITGSFSGSFDFGDTHLESQGPTDAFVARVGGGGQLTYAKGFGGPSGGGDNGMSVAVDHDGNALVTGSFLGEADLGSGPVTTAGGLDVFLSKFPANAGL
jgi:hypothetical protein